MPSTQTSDTPKGTVTLSNVGPGMSLKNVGWGVNNNLKVKRSGLTASLQGTDKTVRPVAVSDLKQFKDVVATVDYKLSKGGVTANTKYELGPKKYTVGATWDGKLAKKATTLKGWYSNKDNLAAGEATVSLNAKNKANVTFNQKKVLGAKYTLTTGHGFTLEPSYNFVKKAPAVAVTKKVGKKGDTIKLTHDIQSEASSLEYNHKPFKLNIAAKCGKSLKVGRPTLSAVFENTYEF